MKLLAYLLFFPVLFFSFKKKHFRYASICLFSLIFSTCNMGFVNGQDVIAISDPAISTDTITSGELIIGINNNGGGVINFLEIPGIGNIFGPQSVKYGRSGQSAMRDGMHRGRYNPTQAGFNETLGTPCIVEKTKEKIIIPARPVALWYGDCAWDFTEWENIGPDPSCYADGGNSDVDELDESELEGKQNTEVKSEFDYFGIYHNYKDKGDINISCLRHYFEYRYAREPGHCINQFRPGLDIFNAEQINPDISTAFPVGAHTAEPFDMSNFILSWHMRNDVVNWDPKYQFIEKKDGNWTIQSRELYTKETLDSNGEVVVPRLLIISDSDSPDTQNAMGFYMPNSEFNNFETIGVNETTGLIAYKDQRYKSIQIWDQPRRIPTMGVYGFKTGTKGLLNPTRLPQELYEAYRFDMFILMGSPNEIWETVNKIENTPSLWNFNSDIENWTFSGGELTAKDSSINMTITENESVLLSPDKLLIDADLHKFLTIRLKNNSPNSSMELSFKKYDETEFSHHSVDILTNTNSWQSYTINVSSFENWTGMIRQIGLNIPVSTGNIEVDFIAISSDGLTDCNGDFGGSAYQDGCGNCVGGNTGVEACEDCMGVINGEAVVNPCGYCVGGSSPTLMADEWHFDNLNNWVLNSRLSGTSNNGIASFTISGVDPYMNYDGNVCLNTKEYKYLMLKIKNNTNGVGAAVYYQNDVSNAWKNKTIQVSQDNNQIMTYSVDMSGEENWVGNIHKIRFDPPGSSGSLELDYIVVLKEMPPTGINELPVSTGNSDPEVFIFPNPASKIFYLKTNIESKIIVYDSRGMEVYRNNDMKLKHSVETANWNSGLYFVQTINSNGIHFSKTMVLK